MKLSQGANMNRKEEIEKMAWVISGPQGSGKSTTAMQIASAYPGQAITLPWAVVTRSVFEFGEALIKEPAVVILEEVSSRPTKLEWALMKSLATEQTLMTEHKGKDNVLVAAPVFIFVLGDSSTFVGPRHFRQVILP